MLTWLSGSPVMVELSMTAMALSRTRASDTDPAPLMLFSPEELLTARPRPMAMFMPPFSACTITESAFSIWELVMAAVVWLSVRLIARAPATAAFNWLDELFDQVSAPAPDRLSRKELFMAWTLVFSQGSAFSTSAPSTEARVFIADTSAVPDPEMASPNCAPDGCFGSPPLSDETAAEISDAACATFGKVSVSLSLALVTRPLSLSPRPLFFSTSALSSSGLLELSELLVTVPATASAPEMPSLSARTSSCWVRMRPTPEPVRSVGS